MHSMTGFGRAECATTDLIARVEMASVNRKQGEVVVQIPRSLSELEAGVKKLILSQLSRGRINVSISLERPEGTFELRRGFALEKGAKVLMVEDVVTTGISSREAIEAVAREGGEVIAEVALVDRSSGEADMGVPFFPLIQLSFPTYAEEDVPAELKAVPITKPGSRK